MNGSTSIVKGIISFEESMRRAILLLNVDALTDYLDPEKLKSDIEKALPQYLKNNQLHWRQKTHFT